MGPGSAHTAGMGDEPVNAGRWHEGSYGSPLESLQDHFAKHGAEVGATDAAQFLRKAEAFALNIKNGRYIDLAPDERIVSFGARQGEC